MTTSPDAAALTLDRLVRRFASHTAVDEVSLSVTPGELVVLLGPSGCGKTTTLRLIAGFIAPDAGDIRLDGQSIVSLPPHKRDMGIVFQSYALFPHLSVARNIAFGLEMRHTTAAATQARVDEMLRLVRLEAFATRLPRQLSGGQQQRVALARALAIHPRALLLDEPLSNLDAALRQDMAREIRLLQQARGITTIMVTHDQTEAMALADRLVLMHDGKVQQIGPPEALHLRPANPFVARFIGGANIVPGRIDTATHLLLPDGAPISLATALSRHRRRHVGGAPRQHPPRRARPRRRPRRRHRRALHLARCHRRARRAPHPRNDAARARPGPWPRRRAAPQSRHACHAALVGRGRIPVRRQRPTDRGSHHRFHPLKGDQRCLTRSTPYPAAARCSAPAPCSPRPRC